MEETGSGPRFSYLNRMMENIFELDSLISILENFVIEKKLKFIVLNSEIANFINLVPDLEMKLKKALECLKATEPGNLKYSFDKLRTLCFPAFFLIDDSKNAINAFILSNGTEYFDILGTNLKDLNFILENILSSPEWDKIFNIRSYCIKYPGINMVEFAALDHYIRISNHFDVNNENFLEIIKKIIEPAGGIFSKTDPNKEEYEYYKPNNYCYYSSIIGPSFMGKTQFSFVLSRLYPILYFNMSDREEFPQDIYRCFNIIYLELNEILTLDLKSLLAAREEYIKNLQELGNEIPDWLKNSSNYPHARSLFIFKNQKLSLFTIGFIWNLIEYSSKFDFNSGEDWFQYYLKDREVVYEPMSLEQFYKRMENLLKNTKSFKIPIVVIDEMPRYNISNVKLLRNIVRCMVLPCVLTSTNAKISNMLNINSASSLSEGPHVWVNAIGKLLPANLMSIMDSIEVIPRSSSENSSKLLSSFVTDSFELKQLELLKYFNINFDEANMYLLLKIWNFMTNQSKTCLQGTSYYTFNEFIKSLKTFEDKSLNSKAIWSDICLNIRIIFERRKLTAFSRDKKYFSLRMFSTDCKFDEKEVGPKFDDSEMNFNCIIRDSINDHFYYFGDANFKNVTSFEFGNRALTLNGRPYSLSSHFLPFESDVITRIVLWHNIGTEGNEKMTVASIIRNFNMSLVSDPFNSNAKSNNFRSQEVLAYWTIANASHHNLDGITGGLEFFNDVVENLQIPILNTQSLPKLGPSLVPESLVNFLNTLTVPYLIPEEPSQELAESLSGLLELGVCWRCPNEVQMDVAFNVIKGQQTFISYVECKYRKEPQGRKEISEYLEKAKAKHSPLTFFIKNCLHSNLKEGKLNSTTRNLRKTVSTAKKAKTEFIVNVYSVFYENYNLVMKCLLEHEDPDGVFIIVETNFNLPQV